MKQYIKHCICNPCLMLMWRVNIIITLLTAGVFLTRDIYNKSPNSYSVTHW